MSANLEAKKLVVEEIKDKLSKSKSVVFSSYNALTVAEDTEMRRQFKKNGAEYKVYKNKLLLLALGELGIQGAENYLHGTTAVAFSYDDEVSGAKITCETAEKTKKLTVKFGLLDGKLVDAKEIEELAKLPGPSRVPRSSYCKTSRYSGRANICTRKSTYRPSDWACKSA